MWARLHEPSPKGSRSTRIFLPHGDGVVFPPGSAVGADASNRWVGVGLLALSALAWTTLVLWLRARRAHSIVK